MSLDATLSCHVHKHKFTLPLSITSLQISLSTMADEQPPTKLPRLDAATTLSKPFKSPLRKLVPLSVPRLASDSVTTDQSGGQNTDLPPVKNELLSCSGEIPVPSSNATRRQCIPSRRDASSRSLLADPELLQLEKKKRSLQARLKSLADEIDCMNQAIQIEYSNKDAELEALIVKWRRIGQDTADEALNIARERVTRLGGMAAWRESAQRAMQWDAEEATLDYDHGEGGGDNKEETPQTGGAALLSQEGQDEVGLIYRPSPEMPQVTHYI